MIGDHVTYVPHLRLVIAGTGIGGFGDEWFLQVNSRMLVRGVEHLAEHAQAGISRLWEKLSAKPYFIEGKTSTIYHFGISEITDQVVVFAFRSTNGFKPERLPHGTATKPGVELPEGNDWETAFREILRRQRAAEADNSPAERIHIGGEVTVIHLTPAECTHRKLCEFDDFALQEAQAYAHFQG